MRGANLDVPPKYLKVAMQSFHRFFSFAAIALCSAHAYADAKEEVLNEIMFCSNFYNGMSTVILPASKGNMEAIRDAFMALAVEVSQSNQAALEKALKATADRAAGEIVGKTAEQRFATSKSCTPLLEPNGVEKAVAARSSRNK